MSITAKLNPLIRELCKCMSLPTIFRELKKFIHSVHSLIHQFHQ